MLRGKTPFSVINLVVINIITKKQFSHSVFSIIYLIILTRNFFYQIHIIMTPNYYSVMKRTEISLPITPLFQLHLFWLLCLGLFAFSSANAQVIISEVYDDNSFELSNTGSDTVDLSTYWICNFPNYKQLNAITIECGNLNLAAGEKVVLSDDNLFGTVEGELGLYSSDTGGFGNIDNIMSYLEWGSTNHQRSGIATTKGIWDGNAVAGFSNGQALTLEGTGTAASDWVINSSPAKCATANCTAVGGILTGGPFSFCVGDGVADNIPAGAISLSGNSGGNSAWVVTLPDGTIGGLPPMPSAVDFDGAGEGICSVWNISYEDGLTGLEMGMNIADLAGCYSLSNPVLIDRSQPEGGTLTGGPFSFCVGDGVADNIPAGVISLAGNSGGNSAWVVTLPDGTIGGLPPMPSAVDFDGAGEGICSVWNISYEDGLTGLEMGMNIADLSGCYSLSNPVLIDRSQPEGGTLTGGPFIQRLKITILGAKSQLFRLERIAKCSYFIFSVHKTSSFTDM